MAYRNGPPVTKLKFGPKKELERKVTVVFPQCDHTQHCAGIESLCIHNNCLFVGSRDSYVSKWALDTTGGQPQHVTTYIGHADWVTGVVALNNAIVSSSQDQTINVWDSTVANVNKVRDPLISLYGHQNYITCLASSLRRIVSGALGGQVLMWQLDNDGSTYSYQPECLWPNDPNAFGSIYAIAVSQNDTLVAAGNTEGLIQLRDPRSPGSFARNLTGHSDNIRALLISPDTHHIISASADSTIRVWDVGQGRCKQLLNMHDTSVRSLDIDPAWTTLYSASRDGYVFQTNLTSRTTELLCASPRPVHDLCYDVPACGVWLATTSPKVYRYDTDPPEGRPQSVLLATRSFSNKPHSRPSTAGGARALPAPPISTSPSASTRGVAPIIDTAVLRNQRQVVTKSEDGRVAMWDVSLGVVVEDYGVVDFKEKVRDCWLPDSNVSKWFVPQCHLGSLSLQLSHSSAFKGEEYECKLPGFQQQPNDRRTNLGYRLLDGIIRSDTILARQSLSQQHDTDVVDQSLVAFNFGRNSMPSIIIHPATDHPMWHNRPGLLASVGANVMPSWLLQQLKTGDPGSVEDKCEFSVRADANCDGILPRVGEQPLQAPTILEVSKVAHYIVDRLQQLQCSVQLRQVFWDRQQVPQASEQTNQVVIEVVCLGFAVPFSMCLSSVKELIFGNKGDLVFNYRIFQPDKPSPLPVLRRPE